MLAWPLFRSTHVGQGVAASTPDSSRSRYVSCKLPRCLSQGHAHRLRNFTGATAQHVCSLFHPFASERGEGANVFVWRVGAICSEGGRARGRQVTT